MANIRIILIFTSILFTFNVNSQIVDTCEIGIPHHKFYLIRNCDLLKLSNFKNDIHNFKFDVYKIEILTEIDLVISNLEFTINNIRSNGYYRSKYFEIEQINNDTTLLERQLHSNRNDLKCIKYKIENNRKLAKKDVIELFNALYKFYSNVFGNLNWIQNTDFRFLNCLNYFLDTSKSISKNTNTFLDTVVFKYRYKNLANKIIYTQAVVYSYKLISDSLTFNIKNYYFPTFEEYYNENHQCILINQERLNFIFHYLMDNYSLISVPYYY